MKKINIPTANIAIYLFFFPAVKKQLTILLSWIKPTFNRVSTLCLPTSLTFEQFVSWGKKSTIIAASEERRMSDLANFHTFYYENSAESEYFLY